MPTLVKKLHSEVWSIHRVLHIGEIYLGIQNLALPIDCSIRVFKLMLALYVISKKSVQYMR